MHITFKECPLCVLILRKPLQWLKEYHLVLSCAALDEERASLGLGWAVADARRGARDEKEAYGRFWGKNNNVPDEEIVIRAQLVGELRRCYGKKLAELGF